MENWSRVDEGGLEKLNFSDSVYYHHALGTMSVWQYLESLKAALKDHFVFTGGGHGDKYINISGIIDIESLVPLAIQIAWEMRGEDIDAVVGTPHGADTLAVLVAYYYTQFNGHSAQVLKLVKSDDGLLKWYKNHGERVRGKKLIQIEDVINSAGSLREASEFISESGGDLKGFFAVCIRLSDKNPGLEKLGQELNIKYARALLEVEAVNYAVDLSQNPQTQCPLCAKGIRVNTYVGHGKKFLVQIKDVYPDLHKELSGE